MLRTITDKDYIVHSAKLGDYLEQSIKKIVDENIET